MCLACVFIGPGTASGKHIEQRQSLRVASSEEESVRAHALGRAEWSTRARVTVSASAKARESE